MNSRILFFITPVLLGIYLFGFPVKDIEVSPEGSADRTLETRSRVYYGTFYTGKLKAEITSEVPSFLKVCVEADIRTEFETGFAKRRWGGQTYRKSHGRPIVRIHVSADSNAVPGKYKIKGEWCYEEITEGFKIYVIVRKKNKASMGLLASSSLPATKLKWDSFRHSGFMVISQSSEI